MKFYILVMYLWIMAIEMPLFHVCNIPHILKFLLIGFFRYFLIT